MPGTITILGGGRIGEALHAGLLSSGRRDESEIVVKPQDIDALLGEIGPGLIQAAMDRARELGGE